MAFRTTPSDVQAIVEHDPTVSMVPYIAAASAMLDQVVASCKPAASLSTAKLKIIETWLAAHFYSVRDQQFSQETEGKGSATYQGQTQMNLTSSKYGQTAMMLDGSNCLASRNLEVTTGMRRVAGTIWGGKPPSAQTPYRDRD